MNHNKFRYLIIPICILLLATTGCSMPPLSTLFMDEAERDAYYRAHPAYLDQALAIDGSDCLLELQNDSFWGKPYNNLLRFGDNILLVGEASYTSLLDGATASSEADVQYEFSFDVYSPWYNRIVASLSHTETTCTAYQVCGDALFLLDDDAMTLSIYDSTLTQTGAYDFSFFEDIDGLTFYPSGEADTCFAVSADSEELYELHFSGSAVRVSSVELPYYDLRVLYASPDEYTLTLFGINADTLQEKIIQMDTQTLAVSAECAAEDATDFIFDARYTFLASGSILKCAATLNEDSMPSSLTFSYYDGTGSGIAEFTYAFEDYGSQADAAYLSQDCAFFDEVSAGFFLVYNADCEPYLLVWDYSQTAAWMEPLAMPDMEAADDGAGGNDGNDGNDGADGAAEADGAASYGSTDMDGYESAAESGELSAIRARADALGLQHGIEIYFGEDVPGEIGIYRLTGASDSGLLAQALDTLSLTLECYPEQFFPQLCFGDTTGITLYLADSISGNSVEMLDTPTGFTDSEDHALVMVLNTEYLWDWDYTISHEISHMIDQRLEYRAAYVTDSLFSEDVWASYNPEGFSYQNTYEDYEENGQYSLYSDYFADAYGTTFPTEDRAELFGLAMSDYLGNFDEDVFFQPGAPTTEKYSYYCASIRDGFDTTGWSEVMPWEKILQN